MELKFWSLDCDIIEGPHEAGEKIATTATPEQAQSLANMLNKAWTRMGELGEIATSAHAIATRRGDKTAWERFAARCVALGIGSITPKTFRVLPSDPQPNPSALELVAAERERQIAKGFTAAHDDEHCHGELREAAAAMALVNRAGGYANKLWPFEPETLTWTACSRTNCVRAAAILVAEIERLDREAESYRERQSARTAPPEAGECAAKEPAEGAVAASRLVRLLVSSPGALYVDTAGVGMIVADMLEGSGVGITRLRMEQARELRKVRSDDRRENPQSPKRDER